MELTLSPILKDKSLLRDSKAITDCCGQKESFEKTKDWLKEKYPDLNKEELEEGTKKYLTLICKITK